MKKMSTKSPAVRSGLLPFLFLFTLMVINKTSWGQTTVFSDDFNRGAVVTPITNGGTPTMTYTTTSTSTGFTNGATSRTNLTAGTDYALQLLPGDAGTGGITHTSGALATFSAPFSTTLNTNPGDLVWTFHTRTNRSTFPLSGFSANNYAGGVVLAATAVPLNSAGNGYAVVFEKGATAVGNAISGNVVIALTSPSAAAAGIVVGMTVTGTGIPANTTITATSANNITLSAAPTSSSATRALTFSWVYSGSTTTGSNSVILTAAPNSNIYVGQAISGTGIPASTTITAISGTTLTISANATATGSGVLLTLAGGTTIKLLKYTGGLTAGTRVPILVPSSEFYIDGNKTTWAAVKIVYTKSSDTWEMFLRNDGSGASSPNTDFSTGLVSAGTVVDNTYTGTAMSNFGFLWNHSTTASYTSNTMYWDNFKVVVNNPTINAPSVSSLSGFTATPALPSAEQNFTISGQYLTNSIVLTAPAEYELSATSGSYTGSSTITLPNTATVNITPIYVRLKSGLTDGVKTGNITITSTGATSTSSYTVALNGTVSSTPTLTPSASSLTAFANTAAGANSTSKNFTISGVNLSSGDVTVTAPANFEVSKDNSTFTPSVNITPSGGAVNSTIYVRYSPTGNGGYTGNVVITWTGLPDQNVSVSGYLSTFYYNTGSLASPASWSGTANLTGTSVPNDFVTPGVSYKILSNATTDAAWTLGGTGSKIIVGDPTVAGVTLTVANTFGITTTSPAVLEIPAALSGSNSIVLADAATTAGSGTTPTFTFGTLHASSEVHLQAGTTSAQMLIPIATYGKLIIDEGGVAITTNLASVVATIKTSLTVGTAPVSTAVLYANSSTNYIIMDIGSGATINGFFRVQRLPGAFTFSVVTPGTTLGSLQYKDAYNSGSPNLVLGSNSTVEYNRTSSGSTSTQAITLLPAGVNYANLTISDGTTGSGFLVTKTFATGAHTVTGTLTVNHVNPATSIITLGTATLNVNGAVVLLSGPLTGSSNLTLGNGVTVTRTSGSFDVAPVFGSSVNLVYDGIAAINSSNEIPTATTILNNLTINNAAGVTLTAPATAKGVLSLTNGNLITTATNILTLSNSATVSGASNTSYVSGPMIRNTNAISAYPFPVGKGGVYRPFSVNATTTNANSFTGEYINTDPHVISSTYLTPVTGIADNEYYDIAHTSGTDAASLSFTLNGAVTGGTITDYIVVSHFNAGAPGWEDAGGNLPGDATSGAITTNPLTSFSPFSFGLKPVGPLPLHLISFDASVSNGTAKLSWKTSDEINMDKFVVEESKDGRIFSAIAHVNPTNTPGIHQYNFTNPIPISGNTYYRLKLLSTNGQVQYSSIILIRTDVKTRFSILSNPVTDNMLHLQISNLPKGTYTIQLVNMHGQLIQEEKLNYNGNTLIQNIPFSQTVAKGMYVLKLAGNNIIEQIKIGIY